MNYNLPVIVLKDLVLFPLQEAKIDLNNLNTKNTLNLATKNYSDQVLIICPKELSEENIDVNDLPNVGVIAQIKTKLELPNGSIRINVKGIKRVAIRKYYNDLENNNILFSEYMEVKIPKYNELEETSYVRKLKKLIKEYIDSNHEVSNSIINTIKRVDSINLLTDIITTFIPLKTTKKLEYIGEINGLKRAVNLLDDLQTEIELVLLDERLDDSLREKLESKEKDFIIREKLNALKKELGESDEKQIEVNGYLDKLAGINPKPKIYNRIVNEIKKYELTSDTSPENTSIRNYLDWVLNLPWNKKSESFTNLNKIKVDLDKTHYGMDKIKDRILEDVAVRKLNENINSPIICLVGPPGVGKTSIASSIAKALNKKFFKISLGGMSDPAELNGHRQTYLGSQPGKIIKALKVTGTSNPVILLDEVDKMGVDYKGDPASVLLDILDQEQNVHFTDNYIDMPFDISGVTFILTANEIKNIPDALIDRLEIIELNSYTEFEKISIAKDYLIPKLFNQYNISKNTIKFSDDILKIIIDNYTKEAGVRELERFLDTICRKVITLNIIEDANKKIKLNNQMIIDLLGNYRYDNISNVTPKPGLVNMLVFTPYGGIVSNIEANYYSGTGKVICTGKLGDILNESIQVAISYIKSNIKKFKISKFNFDLIDIHLHMLNGSIKKDGPSAGVNITTCLLSMLLNKEIPKDIAMTGEITLFGDVKKVGGIKEKLIGAYNNGIKKVFMPKENINDLNEVPDIIKDNMSIILVENYLDIYQELFKSLKNAK